MLFGTAAYLQGNGCATRFLVVTNGRVSPPVRCYAQRSQLWCHLMTRDGSNSSFKYIDPETVHVRKGVQLVTQPAFVFSTRCERPGCLLHDSPFRSARRVVRHNRPRVRAKQVMGRTPRPVHFRTRLPQQLGGRPRGKAHCGRIASAFVDTRACPPSWPASVGRVCAESVSSLVVSRRDRPTKLARA